MADSFATAPAWVGELRERLLSAGFHVDAERRYDEPFGNYWAVLSRGHLVVNPSFDRGVWDIGIQNADAEEWKIPWASRSTDPWASRSTNVHLLRGAQAGTLTADNVRPTDIEDDARWLLANLDTADALVAADATWRRLYELRREYAKACFGVELPTQPSAMAADQERREPQLAPGVRIVRSGHWLYDNTVAKPVDIVALTFDFWHEVARGDGDLAVGDHSQSLGPDGCLYYVRYRKAGTTDTPTLVDGGGFASLDDAVAAAESGVPSPVVWTDA